MKCLTYQSIFTSFLFLRWHSSNPRLLDSTQPSWLQVPSMKDVSLFLYPIRDTSACLKFLDFLLTRQSKSDECGAMTKRSSCISVLSWVFYPPQKFLVVTAATTETYTLYDLAVQFTVHICSGSCPNWSHSEEKVVDHQCGGWSVVEWFREKRIKKQRSRRPLDEWKYAQ